MGNRLIAMREGSRCQACLIHIRWSQDMHHVPALAEQVVGDDPSMTVPPYGLCAHNCAAVSGSC